MKIIKRGTARQLTCYSCRSLLEYEDSDVYLKALSADARDWDSADREDAYGAYVNCAVCKTSLRVAASYGLKKAILEAQDRADHDL